MSFHSRLQRQIGGLYTAVIPFNGSDPIYQSAFASVLEETIRHEAKVHGAAFDKSGFQNVLKALSAKNSRHELNGIEALFFVAGWELSRPKIIGATVNFRSLFLQQNGQDIGIHRGIYSEDVCLLVSKIKELLIERPIGMDFPEEGIGKHFIKGSMRHYATNGLVGDIYPVGQLFEYATDNGNIIKIQQQLNANLGAEGDSALFRLEGLTPAMRRRLNIPVELISVTLPDGGIDPNNFIVQWQDGRHRICTGFTDTLSTFRGKFVAQSQLVGSEVLPPQDTVQDVVAASFIAAENKIVQGRLDKAKPESYSPSIPWDGTSGQILRESLLMTNHEISACVAGAANDDKNVTFNVHVRNNSGLVDAVKNMDGSIRGLGTHAMQTGSLDLTPEMEKAGTIIRAEKPKLILSNNSGPIFKLAA